MKKILIVLTSLCIFAMANDKTATQQCIPLDFYPCDMDMSSMVKDFTQTELDSIAQKNWIVKKLDNKDSLLQDTCHFYFEYTFTGQNKSPNPPLHMDKLEYSCIATGKGYQSVEITTKVRSRWFTKDGQVACDYGKHSHRLQMNRSFSEGLLNGISEIYSNRNLVKSIMYKNGLRDGNEKNYDYNRLTEIRSFSEGKLNGLSKFYDYGEKLVKTVSYKNGIQDGEEKTYFEDGSLKQVFLFSDDVLHGTATEYDKQGNKTKESLYKNGEIESSTQYGNYSDWTKPVLGLSCAAAHVPIFGCLSDCYERIEKKCRCAKKYESKAFVIEQTLFQNGKKQGIETLFYGPCDSDGNHIGLNKKSKESPYENGILNGMVKEFYPNGQLKSTITYENGDAVSEKKCFSKNGRVQKIGTENMKCD